MNFATLKGLAIPEGNAQSIAIGGQTVWTKPVDDPWAAVFASIDAGTYATDYAVGDMIPLDLGSEGVVNMQIAGFDVDDLADGSGKAPISWISKEVLKTSKRMNPRYNEEYGYKEQTATITTNNNSSVSANSSRTISFRVYIQAGEVAEITNTINATEDGTLTITYKGVSDSYGKMEVLVNHEAIVTDYASTTAVEYTMDVVSGDLVTVVAKYTSVEASDQTGSVAFKSTGAFTITTASNNVVSRYTTGYTDATGTIGGWKNAKCAST